MANTTPTPESVEAFIAALQAMITADWQAKGYTHSAPPVISREVGQKYIRVIRADANGSSRSVHCFIDLSNGNILKADGWKRPCKKNPRSNVADVDNGLSGVTIYGATYLR